MDAQEVAANQSQLVQFQRLVHRPNVDVCEGMDDGDSNDNAHNDAEEEDEYVYEDENEDEGDLSECADN